MMLGNDVVGGLNIGNEQVSIFDIDAELSLECLVDVDAGLNVDVASFISPVGVERDWDALL